MPDSINYSLIMPNYHINFTSHKEVLFRNRDDINSWFNCFCSALCKTDSACYTETAMSDHHHSCCRTKTPWEIIRISRDAYSKLFNNKYKRKGPLGERGVFYDELIGANHTLAAFSYSLRNAQHHGVVGSPFEYPHSSINCYFRKELGKIFYPPKLLNPAQIRSILSPRAEFDPSWKMSEEGVFLRESVVDVAAVEAAYGTVRAFNYYMSRKSAEEWSREQEEDDGSMLPITLNNFERSLYSGDANSFAKMLRNETSRKSVFNINDLDLCALIDNTYVPQFDVDSVYQLTLWQKNKIANLLMNKYRPGYSQLKRCLAL